MGDRLIEASLTPSANVVILARVAGLVPAELAQVLSAKCRRHLPLNRQSEAYACEGGSRSSSTDLVAQMAD